MATMREGRVRKLGDVSCTPQHGRSAARPGSCLRSWARGPWGGTSAVTVTQAVAVVLLDPTRAPARLE